MDAPYLLKQAYFNLFKTTPIILGSVTVPIFDEIVPKNTSKPYIIFSTINEISDSNQTNTNYNSTFALLFDITVGYSDNFGGKSDLLLILDQFCNLVRPGQPGDPKPISLLPYYKVISTVILSKNTLPVMRTETEQVVRALVRVQHKIEKITL